MRRNTRHETRGTNDGFTVAEMMITLAVFTVVIGVAYNTLTLNDIYRDLVLVKTQLYRQNKQAVDGLVEELQKSQGARVTITDNASPTPDEIRFQIPLVNSISAQYILPWGGRYGSTDYANYYIRYRVSGTNLIRELLKADLSVEAGTEEIKAANIADLQFTKSSNYVTINITAKKTTLPPQHEISSVLNAAVYLQTE